MYRFHFSGRGSWSELRRAADHVLDARSVSPGDWVCTSRVALEDRNYGDGAFRAQWSSPTRGGEARIAEESESGPGNPRDGYGYNTRWRLEIDDLVIEVGGSDWEPQPRQLLFDVHAPTPSVAANVRQALRTAFGPRRDRSAWSFFAANNVRAARDVDPALARVWLHEALKRGRPKARHGGWHQLLLEQEALEGASERNLAQRMRDTPEDLDAWRRAFKTPPRGWTSAGVARVLERLAPWEPAALQPPGRRHPEGEATVWLRLDDGLGTAAGDRARVDVPLLRAMAPELLAAPELGFDRVQRAHRVAASTVQACWPSRSRRGVMLARVTRRYEEYSKAWPKRPPLERIRAQPNRVIEHHWLWLRKEPLCIQLVSETTRTRRRSRHLGYALGISPGFEDEVMTAIATFCPFRWRPADPDALFADARDLPRERPPTAAKLRGTLKRLDLYTTELKALLRRCHCEPVHGPCEHERALYDHQRRWRDALRAETSPRERFLLQARVSALRAASMYRTSRRVDVYNLGEALRYLAHAGACA